MASILLLNYKIFVLCFLYVFYVSCDSHDADYCSLCNNHTMCIYKDLGYKCGYSSTGGFLTEDEKKIIVDTHNKLREFVASGAETRGDPGPQPSASDMQQLEWDEELAKTAQAWADQCDFGHDACRLDPRFAVGQNVFLSEGGVPWEQAILSWYSEVQFLDNSIVDDFIFDAITGHYAQMMWGNTRYIGCGKRTYPQKLKRYYKRDTSHVESLEPKYNQESSFENIRQARKIDHYQYTAYHSNKQYPNRNYDFSSYTYKPPTQTTKNQNTKDTVQTPKRNYNSYDFSSFTQHPKTYSTKTKDLTYKPTDSFDYSTHSSQTPQPTVSYETKTEPSEDSYYYQPQDNYYQTYIDEQWKKYNATIQQYSEKYKNSLQNSDDLKKQLQFYRNYLDQMKQLTSPYLNYEQKSQIFYELQTKHETLQKIHQRLIYHDQKLKDKIARTKKLNPYIPKEYTFSTEKPIIGGQVFEYYVCNYGPTGLWPGARMYTRGWNQCQHDGLCKDPLTVSYYPGVDRKNDPILALLYENTRK